MSKKSLYVLGILLIIAISTFFHQRQCCCECNKADSSKNVESNEQETLVRNGFAVSGDAGDGLDLKVQDNYNFNESSDKILEPLSADVTTSVGKVKSYMDANPDQQLTIVGHYKSSETNSSAYPDLGMARANAVKNSMVAQGVAVKSIFTKSQLDEDFSEENGVLYGPVSFAMSVTSAQSTDWDSLKKELQANPLVLYFNTGQASINLTSEQRQKVANLSNYLDHVDGAKCLVIGHTDNKGSRATNVSLGMNRAQFARDYLVNNGIDQTKVVASSKGPDEPTADNTTEDGRAKNRRTVVTLK